VHRAATGIAARPSPVLSRPGTVGPTPGRTTLRGATVVTGDGAVHTLPGPGCATDLWWAFRVRPGAVGVVTTVVLDVHDTAVALPRTRTTSEERFRLVHLARRHDPAGLLGVPR
jgi:FAD/FMN-containing dehydrogenase